MRSPIRSWSTLAASALFGFLFTHPALAALTVTSVTPSNAAFGVTTTKSIVITFNKALNPATISASTLRVGGRYSGPVPLTIALNGANTQVTLTPQRPYFTAEMVSLYASSAIKAGDGDALTNGFYSSFYVKAGIGSKQFELADTVEFREPGEGMTRLYGFNAVDVDGDGSPDMSGTNELSSDVRVKLNDGCGHYSANVIVPLGSGQEPSPNDAGDLNGDGKVDLVTGNQGGATVGVFLNNGAGSYQLPVLYSLSGGCHGVAMLDADGDGDLDVAASNLTTVRIFKNNGSGVLNNSGGFDGGGVNEWQVAVGDANVDGFADLFVACQGDGNVGLLRNNGNATFTLSSVRNIGTGAWPIAVGDVNGDGFVDAVAGDNSGASVSVLRGNGAGGMSQPTSYGVGFFPVSTRLADIDGDSDLDLSVANFGSADCYVFWNNAGIYSQAFVLPSEQSGSCSVLCDYDRDGDTDIFVTDELTDKVFVFRQKGPTPATVQPPACEATLRIDNFALREGFGTLPPHSLSVGGNAHIGVSGAANQPWLLLLGVAAAPGLPTAAGLFNLSGASPVITVLPFGALSTNAFGESLLVAPVPTGAATGIPATLQAAVGAPGTFVGAVFTNPETVVLVP